MRRVPVIGVTGGIASGKTTVARLIAAAPGGALIDCDALGHEALRCDAVRERLVEAFGAGVLAPSGAVSRGRLARIVFGDDGALARLDRIVKPVLRRIITAEVLGRRASARYIVLDAVLLFQYTFSFKIDCVVVTEAPRETRLRRIMRRDGISRGEALARIERQRWLEDAWARADVRVRSDRPLSKVRREAEAIRERVLARRERERRNAICMKR